VGTLLDTTVFIQLERELSRVPVNHAMAEMDARLERELGADEEVGMAAITASELLHGVHRADRTRRAGREAFVEAVIVAFPPLPFDLPCARAHARLWADLPASGSDVGPHDRLVAATAVATGWRVATANVRHFERIAGVHVVSLNLAE
jgi:tRNA(fMet)-specific endonuclease VapC